VILAAGLACVSCTVPGPSTLSPSMLPLRMLPQAGICVQGGQEVRCLVVREDDWEDLVLNAKAWCLALGGSAPDCQTAP